MGKEAVDKVCRVSVGSRKLQKNKKERLEVAEAGMWGGGEVLPERMTLGPRLEGGEGSSIRAEEDQLQTISGDYTEPG